MTGIELSIVDESDTGADIADIHARMYVDCVSKPHGIDGRYLVVSRTRDYLNPSGNTVTVGAAGVALTSAATRQAQNLTAVQEQLTGQSSSLSKVEAALEDVKSEAEDVSELKVQVKECYSEITKSSESLESSVRETYVTKTSFETLQQDFETSITENSSEIRMDFKESLDKVSDSVMKNQRLLEEYIRFKGALIELGKVGNAFTAELSNEELAFKEDGQTIAYISNQSLVITNAEIRNKLSLGNENRGWFDFLPRSNGNLSLVWRDPAG